MQLGGGNRKRWWKKQTPKSRGLEVGSCCKLGSPEPVGWRLDEDLEEVPNVPSAMGKTLRSFGQEPFWSYWSEPPFTYFTNVMIASSLSHPFHNFSISTHLPWSLSILQLTWMLRARSKSSTCRSMSKKIHVTQFDFYPRNWSRNSFGRMMFAWARIEVLMEK